MAWPALVLTAGLGTRLRPLSAVRAKPAMPVAGRPLVLRILDWLASHGVVDVVLNLHHEPETITRVVGDGSLLGLRVRYSWEDPILGSAGGPRQALSLLDSPGFFVVNGDTLSDVNLADLRNTHEASDALVTLALVVQPDPSRYGGVSTDASGLVEGFVRRGMPSRYHFIGVQAATPDAFLPVPPGQAAESVTWLYPRLLAERRGAVRGFVSACSFADIGTPADYLATSLSIAARERHAGALTGEDCAVDPSACIEESVLWDRVVVEAGASLRRSVVADDVRIPAGSRFENAAILRQVAGYVPDAGDECTGDLVIRRF